MNAKTLSERILFNAMKRQREAQIASKNYQEGWLTLKALRTATLRSEIAWKNNDLFNATQQNRS